MKSKIWPIISMILLLILAAAVYFIFDLSNQKNGIATNLQRVDQQLNETEIQLSQVENQVS